MVKLALSDVGLKPGFIKAIMIIVDSSDDDMPLNEIQKNKIYNLVEKLIVKSTDVEASQLLFSMATHFRHTLQHSKSKVFESSATCECSNTSSEEKKLTETLDVNSWNCSCRSLQVQIFARLVFIRLGIACRDGAQKWQRA